MGKIIDGARSGLNSLLEKISADDTPLSGVGREALDAELVARKALAGGPSEAEARVRWVGAGPEAARRRAEAAAERAKRIGAEPKPKAAASGASAPRGAARPSGVSDEDFRRFREAAKRGGPLPGSGGGGASGARTSSGRRGGKEDKIAKAYRTLDLPDGVAFDQVKAQYRKLMRKYHPDLHGQSAQKQKAATELSMQLTQAYTELDQHLNKK